MRNLLHISIIFPIFVMLSYIIGARVPDIEGNFFALEHKDTALPCRSRNSFGSPDEGLSKGRGGIPFLLPPQNLNAMLKNSSGDDVALASEIWKDIHGYEGLYQVSNQGLVRRLHGRVTHASLGTYSVPGKIRKHGDNGSGYQFLPLCKNGKIKNHYVHRLVAEAFLLNPENKKTVNHKDGDKSNNVLSNLEWATQSENSQHGFNNGLIKQNKGRNNPGSRPIRQYSLKGDFLREYDSIIEASHSTGIHAQNIGCACRGIYKKAGGFIWKYKEASHETA